MPNGAANGVIVEHDTLLGAGFVGALVFNVFGCFVEPLLAVFLTCVCKFCFERSSKR